MMCEIIAEIIIKEVLSNIATNEDNSIALYWSVVTITEHLILSYKLSINALSHKLFPLTYEGFNGEGLCSSLDKNYDAFVVSLLLKS